MSYAAAVERLHTLGQELAPASGDGARRKFDLAHMRTLLAALGRPEQQFRSVLIAGTNGKGSTSATLASIVAAGGYRTGLYTSPHLVRVNERVQVSFPDHPTEYSSVDVPSSLGEGHLRAIPDQEFARLYFRVDEVAQQLVSAGALPQMPSFFEVLTALAFLFFAEQRVDLAVLEVGLGGRLDATNVVEPLLSVVTDIALDHQAYLGDTLTAITREKAGILRPDGTLVTLPQHPEVNQALGEIAAEMPAMRAVSAADMLPMRGRGPAGLRGNEYDLMMDGERVEVRSPLSGEHQQRNIALALTAAQELRARHGYILNAQAVAGGVRETVWPGRLEWVRPRVLLDVAHNPAGMWTLRAYLSRLPESQPRTLIFSCLQDKDLAEMTQILLPLFDAGLAERGRDHVIVTAIDSPRATPVAELLAAAQRLGVAAHAAPHVGAALRQAEGLAGDEGLIVGSGSVYLVGELRRMLVEATVSA